MADITSKVTNYTIGAVIGIVFYHYVLRVKYPGTFPALNSANGIGCNNCGQQVR